MKPLSIVVLTGAGISAESGIKTFRDHDGLWENHRLEDVCTPEGFERNPDLVLQFYNARRAQLLEPDLKPNKAHLALAEFEQGFEGDFFLITQNVDNLHERAGSSAVCHMHGELQKARCTACQVTLSWIDNIDKLSRCSQCSSTGALRPHIVWFGEMPLDMALIGNKLKQCDLFIAIGTSGEVYPAAGFVQDAKYYGAKTVEINVQASKNAALFDEQIIGLASVEVENYLSHLTS